LIALTADSPVLSHSIVPSITQIKPDEWCRLFGELSEDYDSFLTLESSGLEGFGFCYALVYAGNRLELIAPLFWSNLDLGIGVEGVALRVLRIVRKIFPRFLVERTLFCGAPFAENGAIGLAADSGNKPALLAELIRAMELLCRKKALTFIMFKDFPASALEVLAPLARLGFLKGDSFPNVVLPLPYGTMDEYLASLSHGTRKELRRKVRKALSDGLVQVRVVDQVEDIIESLYKLYINTYNAGTVHFEKLTPGYFIEVGRTQRGQAKFFLYYVNGRLACFNLCFRHADRLIDKFIGMDYSNSRQYNIYFYSWYHNVQWCIQNGIRYYQVGQTDHDAKVHLGGKLVPLYFYAKHSNRLLNNLLRSAARFLMPCA
jgi:predicted N-acyltransferase